MKLRVLPLLMSCVALLPFSARAAELPQPGSAGAFLSSHFAQQAKDWNTANSYLEHVLSEDPENPDLLKRSLVLSMGEGDLNTAEDRAARILSIEPKNGLALLVLAVAQFKRNEIDAAAKTVAAMPSGDVSEFVRPVMQGWLSAAKGNFDTTPLTTSPLHYYNAGLMALYLGRKDDAASYAQKILDTQGITAYEIQRAADLLAAVGKNDEALKLYTSLTTPDSADDYNDRKVTALQENDSDMLATLIPPLRIKSPAQGIAVALYDMAGALYQEQSDSSAKLFAHMALALDPEEQDIRLLLANTLARQGMYDEAIGYFEGFPKDHPDYLRLQRHIASLMEQANRKQDALALLNKLYREQYDIDSMIHIGDIHRHDEEYKEALKAYNTAAKAIGDEIPREYWQLLYARGMCYERIGQWDLAEKDLLAALAYRPDHPYILNYLGYAWADQGLNLDKALDMIRRAATLRPSDGYIIDSLGWALYMMGNYPEALPHLEKAVELMPYDATLNDHLGDAYWQVGRKLEAKFQWERAINNSKDEAQIAAIREKLKSGPAANPATAAK